MAATALGKQNFPRDGWSSTAGLGRQRRTWRGQQADGGGRRRGGGGGLPSLLQIQWQRSRTPIPLVNIVKPDVADNEDDNNNGKDNGNDNDDNDDNNKGMVLRGGKR